MQGSARIAKTVGLLAVFVVGGVAGLLLYEEPCVHADRGEIGRYQLHEVTFVTGLLIVNERGDVTSTSDSTEAGLLILDTTSGQAWKFTSLVKIREGGDGAPLDSRERWSALPSLTE